MEKPTQKQIELYVKIRGITEPYHMYQDQIMAIAKWIEANFILKNESNNLK